MRRAKHFPAVVAVLLVALALGATACGKHGVSGSHLSTPGVTPSTARSSPASSGSGSSTPKPADAAHGICTSAAHPALAAELSQQLTSVLRHRTSRVGIAAEDPADGMSCRYHQWRKFHSASTVKVIILSSLLYELQPGHHYLSEEQVELAHLMITESDNDAATALWNEIGMANLQRFLDAAKMSHTELGQDGYWGLTVENAHDEMRLLRLLVTPNKVLNKASRLYVLKLMGEVIPSQRWGDSAGAPTDVTVHIKNGWLPDPDLWVINSLGDFTSASGSYSIVILTNRNPNMGYGVDTVQKLARPINQRFAAG